MGYNAEKDAQKWAATHQKILETALHVFAEKTIDAVNLTEIANKAGVGIMTVYRHFDKKPDLVLAVSTWAWERYRNQATHSLDQSVMTAAEFFEFYLNSFIDLYRNHRDLLCFNLYFNVYVKREDIPTEQMQPYANVIDTLARQFHNIYLLGCQDGTLRVEKSEKAMFSATLHLMLAAVARYAAGLVFDAGIDPESELLLLKKMLMKEYTMEK